VQAAGRRCSVNNNKQQCSNATTKQRHRWLGWLEMPVRETPRGNVCAHRKESTARGIPPAVCGVRGSEGTAKLPRMVQCVRAVGVRKAGVVYPNAVGQRRNRCRAAARQQCSGSTSAYRGAIVIIIRSTVSNGTTHHQSHPGKSGQLPTGVATLPESNPPKSVTVNRHRNCLPTEFKSGRKVNLFTHVERFNPG